MPKLKRERKKKTKPDAPGAMPGIGDNSGDKPTLTDDQRRELFLHHRTKWNTWRAKRAVVDDLADEVKADLKADGFTLKQMKIADQLADIVGEAKVKSEVSDRLQVALWIGHPLGAQLDLFAQPDRTPSVERAFENGKTAGMEGQPRKPPHSPETPQYEQWMTVFYEGQKLLIEGGIKRAEPVVLDDIEQGATAN